MNSNRRNFLKLSGLTGIGLATGELTHAEPGNIVSNGHVLQNQKFNMSGYAAPKLETVRIGFIGLGNRGPGAVGRMKHIEGVKIVGLCDIRPEKAEAAKKSLEGSIHTPELYSGSADAWKKMVQRQDIDLIYIATPWALHTPMAVFAMEHGKHVCTEVPAAKTVEECWQLVETSEKTKQHCMMLENCCYDFFELMTLNMVRQGLFGDIVHGEGAYNHDLLNMNFDKNSYYDMWRLKENFRNGNLYPTHGLGPVAWVMNLNRGDKMDILTSSSSVDFSMSKKAKELAAKDDFYKQFENAKFRGNMNVTNIRTALGRTIMLEHDVSSPNVYSRIFKISGTKGSALKYPEPGRMSFGDEWMKEDEMKKMEELYQPPIVKKVGELAKQVGGHGGMDFLMDWRTIDCLRNGLALDQNVYDAALWSSVAPLSEWSVKNHSNSIEVPDFTRGSWKNNQPVDIELKTGGTTKVLM